MSKPRKRKGSPYYWYDFTVGGLRYRGSTETDCLETSKAIIAKKRTEALENKNFGKKEQTTNLGHASSKFILEHAQYLKSLRTINGHVTHILDYFGQDYLLSSFRDKDLSDFVSSLRKKYKNSGDRLISDTTINRIMETLRKMLNIAEEKWEFEVGNIHFRKHRLKQPEARTRWITKEEAESLINNASDHLKAPIQFALLTGVRLSNITGLQWKNVNLKHREITFRIKSNIPGGKLLVLPITDNVMDLLNSLQKRNKYQSKRIVKDCNGKSIKYITKPDDYVFTYKGDRIKDSFRKSFKTACKKSNIENFRFHDLRHTAASWMIQSGIPIDLVQEILGHTQIATTKKYAHRDQKERMEAMALINFKAQSRHTGYKEEKLIY